MMINSSLLKKISAAASLCGLALTALPAEAATINLSSVDQDTATETSGSKSVSFVGTTYGFFGDSNITFASLLTVFTNQAIPECSGTPQPFWGQTKQGRTDFDADIAYVSCPLPDFTGLEIIVTIQ